MQSERNGQSVCGKPMRSPDSVLLPHVAAPLLGIQTQAKEVIFVENMLSVEDLARQFNVSPRTVVRLVEKRELRALRVGRQWRFKREWVDEWIRKNTRESSEDIG
jgi:excisionase family DNA binding protein